MSDGTQLTMKELGAGLVGPGPLPGFNFIVEAATWTDVPDFHNRPHRVKVKGYGKDQEEAILNCLNRKAQAEAMKR